MFSNEVSLVKFRSSGVIAFGLGVDEDAHLNNQFDWVGLGRLSVGIFHNFLSVSSPAQPLYPSRRLVDLRLKSINIIEKLSNPIPNYLIACRNVPQNITKPLALSCVPRHSTPLL